MREWLCDHYNRGGWPFRYRITVWFFFPLHEKICLDNEIGKK